MIVRFLYLMFLGQNGNAGHNIPPPQVKIEHDKRIIKQLNNDI